MIYFFDKNMELKKLVVSSNVYNPTHQQVKNGMILAQLEFDIDYAFMFIDKVEYFGYFYNEVFYLHRIKTVEPDFVDNIMTVAGNHIFFDDMIGYNYIKDVRPFNRDANYVLQDTIGAVTRWEIVMTDATASLSSSFYYLTPMEALEQIVKDYQVEYEPRILFDGKKINGYQLHVANKLGNQDAKRVRFGDKVLQLKYDIDYSDISTAVIGRGKGEEVGDGYGRRIEFTDINFSRNGVVSPVGKNYMEDPRITDLYGYDDGTPKYEIVIFEDIENVNQLAEATYNYYVENAKPKMLFETEVTDIGIKHIGDSLLIVKPENNLAFKVRVEKIDVNLHNPEVPTMELGDYEYFQESKVERKTRENNEKVQGELSDRIAQLKREANERFDKIVEQWKSEYEQVLIDVAAEVEAMRVTMTEEFETAQREFEEEFNQSVADAKKHADDVADAKAKEVQGNLNSFKGEHELLVGELQGNIVNINGEIADAKADVSEIVGRLTGVDGRLSATESSLTVMDEEISSVVGRVSNNETNISSVVQDVNSITSTVATLEGDVATQGSQISQANDAISSKVWMDDVAEIGANLIPQSANAWEDGSFWSSGGEATDSTTRMNIRMKESIPLILGEQYTLSDYSMYVSAIKSIAIHQWDDSGRYVGVSWVGRGETLTFTAIGTRLRISMHAMSGFSIPTSFIGHLDGRIKVKLEQGTAATPMLNAISHIQQTADKLSFKVAELSNINGEEILTQSDISIESDRIIIGSQQIGSNTLASLISVRPESIDLITDKMNLTGNLNVKGQIESISMSAIKADFAEVFAGTADIQFILAKHLASDSIQARHLYVSNAMAEKLIANTVMAREVKALSLDAVEANIGSIRSKILTSNVIKSSHIAGGTALIDKIFSSNAMFERMMAKSGFVTTLNTVTIDTDQITIRRPDGARLINNGTLQASFDVQIRPNHASSAVEFTGINYATSSSTWQTFEHFYTDHKGSKLLISWAVDFYGPSASEYIEVRVRGFGGNNPIGTSNKKIFSNGSTEYLNHTVNLGVPDYKTIQAYLEFRRSPNGSSSQNTVRARVLRVSLTD